MSETGLITFPLIGNVEVGGLACRRRRKRRSLPRSRAVASFRQPQVNIIVLQMRGNQVSVLGQVNRPGRFPLETLSRVSDMLAMAGEPLPAGDDSAIVLGTRDGQALPQSYRYSRTLSGEQSEHDITLCRWGRDLRTSCPRFLYLW